MKIQSIIHYGTGIDSFADDNKGFRSIVWIILNDITHWSNFELWNQVGNGISSNACITQYVTTVVPQHFQLLPYFSKVAKKM